MSFSPRSSSQGLFVRKKIRFLSRQAAIIGSLSAMLMLPASPWAEENALAEIEPIAELALDQPQKAAVSTNSIRMKLYGITPFGQIAQPNSVLPGLDADEAKKQALARHLAAKFGKHEETLREYIDLVWAEAAKRQRLKPELLIAIIQKESAFRPQVQSRYGAQGLMQVVPRWHREKFQSSESLFDPEVNIRVGADVLEEYLAQANGNLDSALRKYSGNSRNYANSVMQESRALARIAEEAADQG